MLARIQPALVPCEDATYQQDNIEQYHIGETLIYDLHDLRGKNKVQPKEITQPSKRTRYKKTSGRVWILANNPTSFGTI